MAFSKKRRTLPKQSLGFIFFLKISVGTPSLIKKNIVKSIGKLAL
jgi:hypothetical protein